MRFIKNMIQAHIEKKDDFITEWYWRRKYNSLESELELLKEVMASDVYDKVLKEIGEPLKIKQYQRTIERLNNKIKVLTNELNKVNSELAKYKKKGAKK